MTKTQLIRRLAEAHSELLIDDVRLLTNQLLEQLSLALINGDRIEIRGFGSFSVQHRPARIFRNPKTGEQLLVGESFFPRFRVGKALREGVAKASAGQLNHGEEIN